MLRWVGGQGWKVQERGFSRSLPLWQGLPVSSSFRDPQHSTLSQRQVAQDHEDAPGEIRQKTGASDLEAESLFSARRQRRKGPGRSGERKACLSPSPPRPPGRHRGAGGASDLAGAGGCRTPAESKPGALMASVKHICVPLNPLLFWPYREACGILVPRAGMEPQTLTTGPPRNSINPFFKVNVPNYKLGLKDNNCSIIYEMKTQK